MVAATPDTAPPLARAFRPRHITISPVIGVGPTDGPQLAGVTSVLTGVDPNGQAVALLLDPDLEAELHRQLVLTRTSNADRHRADLVPLDPPPCIEPASVHNAHVELNGTCPHCGGTQ